MKKVTISTLLCTLLTYLCITQIHASTSNPNLKYFGYLSTEGLTAAMSSTYLSEMDSLGNSNIAWGYADNLQQFHAHNISVLLTDIRWKFFTGKTLRSDWQTQWNTYKNRLLGKEHMFYGFYFDEPFWYGYNPKDFETITKQIHTDFPTKAIMIIEAWPMFRDNKYTADSDIVTHGLTYVTDIGLDFYFSRTENNSWDEYISYYTKLKRVSGNRKIWLVPDGYAANQIQIDHMKLAFDKYVSLAKSDTAIAGILTFIYTTDPKFSINMRDLFQRGSSVYDPTFRAHHIETGKTILANNPIPTKTPLSGDINDDKKVDSSDYNTLIANFGKTGASGWIPSDIIKNGKVDIFDYTIVVGNFGKTQ